MRIFFFAIACGWFAACTIESDPRATPDDFSRRALRYSSEWSKKSLDVQLRDSGSACVTLIQGCLCNIRRTLADGTVIQYAEKLCAAATGANSQYYRLDMNCYSPSSTDDAKRCLRNEQTTNSCKDADGGNEFSLLFRTVMVDEPSPGASQYATAEEFNPSPNPTQSPLPFASTVTVHADLVFCSPSPTPAE
jgi:hypothetical protein